MWHQPPLDPAAEESVASHVHRAATLNFKQGGLGTWVSYMMIVAFVSLFVCCMNYVYLQVMCIV